MGGEIKGKEVSKSENKEKPKDLGFFQLFRFATWWELFLIFLGVVFATGLAGCWPLILIAYGEFTTLLVERTLTRGEVTSTPFLQLVGGGESM